MTVDFAAMRAAMVESQLRTSEVNDPRIIAAMGKVERERFVPPARAATCYIDRAIPLGKDRALNPPLATGRLLIAADVQPGQKILVVGAATGYLAALLVELGADVVALEVDATLAGTAPIPAAVQRVTGPLAKGAPAHAPFDAIILDGAVEELPQTLIDQLADGGRIATGIIQRGVTRLEAGRKISGALGLNRLAEMEMVVLPGFEVAKSFVF